MRRPVPCDEPWRRRGAGVALRAGVALTLAAGVAGCASMDDRFPRAKAPAFPAVFPEREAEAAAPAWRAAELAFDDVVRHALEHQPRVRAAFERFRATRERIPQARSLEDPELSFEYFLDQMDTRHRVGITQTIPAFGKRGAREAVAEAQTAEAWHAFEAERLALIEEVTRAYCDYWYLARAISVTEENARLLAGLEAAVEAAYRAGAASFADAIRAQVERARVADRLASLRDRRSAQSAALAGLLNLPAATLLPWPAALPSESRSAGDTAPPVEWAERNPELKARAAAVDAARSREALARRARWPDLMVGAGWMVMPGADGRGNESDVGLMAGIALPVWTGRLRAAIQEAGAGTAAARHEYEAHNLRLETELVRVDYRIRDAERQLALFRSSVLPKSAQALTVARQAYADGAVEFMAVIDAQRSLLEFQLMAERAAADRDIARAEHARLTGGVVWGETLSAGVRPSGGPDRGADAHGETNSDISPREPDNRESE